MVFAVIAIAPQPPKGVEQHETIRRSIAEGLRYVRGNQALLGSFAIDLVAMTFGMPRALFAVLAVSVYHAGAAGTGVLYSAVSRRRHRRRDHDRLAVAYAASGAGRDLGGDRVGRGDRAHRPCDSLWVAALLLAVAGAADSVSAVCRNTINQTVTPDRLRGRMSSVFSLVVTSGPRLGDIESGTVAGVTSPRFSVVGGLGVPGRRRDCGRSRSRRSSATTATSGSASRRPVPREPGSAHAPPRPARVKLLHSVDAGAP